MREAIVPDLRLRVLSVLPGLPVGAPLLLARCALVSDTDETAVATSDDNDDAGTVVFSLAALQVPAAGASAAATPAPPPALLPGRLRTEVRGGQPSLAAVSTPADLVALLRVGAEVWVFEPWTAVVIAGTVVSGPQQSQDAIEWGRASDVDGSAETKQALVCTRFAVLRWV